MNEALIQTLFYPQDLAVLELQRLVQGARKVVPSYDILDFSDEDGGEDERTLAVPLLAGMDEIEVQQALMRLRARTARRDITGFTVSQGSGNEAGVILVLPSLLRLLEVDLAYPVFPQSVRDREERFHFLDGNVNSRADGNTAVGLRLVLRPALNAAPPYEFAPPVFAQPDFGAPGPLYGPTLGGVTVRDLGDQQFKASIPGVRGSVWLLQLAHGDKPEELQPLEFSAAVHRVVIDAATTNLTVSLAGAGGDVRLWAHPEALYPEAGEQEVDFTPLAQRHLQEALAAAGTDPAEPALGLPLRFHSDSAGELDVTARILAARYLVRPLGAEPKTISLQGSWTDLELEAPAGRRPTTSSGRVVVKHLGRELNDQAALPPQAPPHRGLRVDAERWVAAAVTVQPVPGAEGQPVPIAAVRLFLSTWDEAEAVVQLHSGAPAAPGPAIGRPQVRQIEAGFSGWLDFPLDGPISFDRLGEPLWLALRSNRGEVRWFTADTGEAARVSLDRGETWAVADGPLQSPGAPWAQLFHVAPEPLSVPLIEVWSGEQRLADDLLAAASAVSPREFARDDPSLPTAILDQLAATGDGVRTRLPLKLFSTAVVSLTVSDLLLFYDPYPPGNGGAS